MAAINKLNEAAGKRNIVAQPLHGLMVLDFGCFENLGAAIAAVNVSPLSIFRDSGKGFCCCFSLSPFHHRRRMMEDGIEIDNVAMNSVISVAWVSMLDKDVPATIRQQTSKGTGKNPGEIIRLMKEILHQLIW